MWGPEELMRSQVWCHMPGIQYLGSCGKRIINCRLVWERDLVSKRVRGEEKEERERGNREEGNLKGRKKGEGKESKRRESKGKRK